MKKKLLALLLTLALLGSLAPAALAEGETFTDVPAGSWFEQGVATCAENGIMVGTGDGLFSPEKALSQAECLTLALRLYDLRRGGTGELEKAPEDWGKITFTLSDGTVVEGKRDDPFGFYSFKRDANADAHLYFRLEPDQVEWGKSVDGQPATVTLDDETYEGVARCWDTMGGEIYHNWVISFYAGLTSAYEAEMYLLPLRTHYERPHPDVTKWYRDAAYTAEIWGLNDMETWPGFFYLSRDLDSWLGQEAAYRYQFASALAEATGELPKLYDVEELPDLKRDKRFHTYDTEAIFALYEAGILTGTDEYGTFDDVGTLTRAQAAVMVARVLDESQRVTTPPKAMDPQTND